MLAIIATALGVTNDGVLIIWCWILATVRLFHMLAIHCAAHDRERDLPRALAMPREVPDDSIPFRYLTDEQALRFARLIERAVARDPGRYLHQKITPFATPADLMGGPPPSRWRLWARARWRDRLFVRAHQELLRQRVFARGIERMLP